METREILETALRTEFRGFHLYGHGMDVRDVPGYVGQSGKIVGTKTYKLRGAGDGIHYYLSNGRYPDHDIFSFNVCQGFEFKRYDNGDVVISRGGLTCTLLTHAN